MTTDSRAAMALEDLMGDAANGALDVLAVHHLGHRLDANGTLPISLLPGLTGPCFKGESTLADHPLSFAGGPPAVNLHVCPNLEMSGSGSPRQCGEHAVDEGAGSLGGVGLGEPDRLRTTTAVGVSGA